MIKEFFEWLLAMCMVAVIIAIFAIGGVLVSAALVIGILAFSVAAVVDALSLRSPERSDGEREGERRDDEA